MKRDTKLLIVEDELVSAKVIERILRNKGYVNIKTVSDGLAAINEVDLSQPDLILMDIDLGNGIDGIETADKILAKFDIPIIYLTAYTTDALTERAKITGAFSYLTKPVNSETLVTNIELSLKKKHGHDRRISESENRLAGIINSALDSIITFDDEYKVLIFNPSAEKIFSCDSRDVIGKTLDHLIPGDLLDSSFRVKSGKKKTPVKEISVSRRNGEVFPCEVSISTAEISGRIYYTIILRDITDRKNAEEILRKSKEELEIRVKERTAELSKTNKELTLEVEKRKLVQEELRKADRLATIGKMSAVLAHEIRNPLNSIKINTDILFESKDISPDKKNRLQIVQKEVIRLNNLLKEVLMYARHTELIISEFNLNNLIESLRIQLNSNIAEQEISFLNGLGNISIRGDIEKLKQVFLNLILNSIDAVPKGGTIEISYKKDESNISVFVKDNGAGIENPEKIFEPFYTTKNTGTGLGLSISQNIIELHWGSLKLLSSKKGETIFEIKLPV